MENATTSTMNETFGESWIEENRVEAKESAIRETRAREKYEMHRSEWKRIRKICPTCMETFFPHQRAQKYCQSRCHPRYYRPHLGHWRILARDDFRCVYCGHSAIEERVKLHVDHIIPRSKDGNDTDDNLVTSCELCNVSRGAMDLTHSQLLRIMKRIRRDGRRMDTSIEKQGIFEEIIK